MSEYWHWALLAFLLAATILLIRSNVNLQRLIEWAQAPFGTAVPDANGRWGDAFQALHRRAKQAAEQRQQLREALDRFRQAAQAMPDGVVILGHQYTIEWLNTHAERLLGLDADRDTGLPVVNLVRAPEFIDYLRGGQYGAPLVLHPQRGHAQALQIQAVPFALERIMVLVRDISQIERLETMRRDFVANVSHELKTPLTVVSGFLETLEAGHADMPPGEVQHCLALAAEQAVRMGSMIEDLLTLSSLETDAPPREEPVDVATLIAGLADEARALSSGRHRLEISDSGPAGLVGNGREIRSALGNLISNAVRYTPAGGLIALDWRSTEDGGAAFSVRDSGIGIDSQHIGRLTERFYRVDRGRSRETGGTGLGLAIVKHVLERHGARLEIDSRLGEGSCFTVRFPPRRVAAQEATRTDVTPG